MAKKNEKKEKIGDERDWKPIKRGNTFCSPACGCGCTLESFDRVTKRSAELVKMMKGSGWKAVVHENCGWHYCIVSGPVQVYESDTGFWSMVAAEVDGKYGASIWTHSTVETHDDPNEAVKEALDLACSVHARLGKVIEAARVAAGVRR